MEAKFRHYSQIRLCPFYSPIFPTIIEGNTVHINSRWPVERISVTAGNGNQVVAKEINGQKDYMSIVIPPVSKGIYWITFYGNGWKTTTKFIVP